MNHPVVGRWVLQALACVLFFWAAPSIRAAGLWLYERGTPEVGTANAGVAARAEDASTAASNPAGIPRLGSPQLLLGFQSMILDVQFDPGAGTTTTGPDGDASGFIPVLSASYAHPLGDRWGIGFTLGSNFGLGVKYEDDWVGRYFIQEGALITLDAVPTVGFKVTEWLSVGSGVLVQYAVQNTQAAINNIAGPDGELEFKADSWGVGGLVSLLVEPFKGTRFGMGYVTPIKHKFEDEPRFSGLSPGMQTALGALGVLGAEVGIEMTMPQGLMVSGFHEINDRWAVMGNVGWQDWSDFGEIPISVSSTTSASLTQDRGFDDTWHVAIGLRYRFLPAWAATVGFAHDSSPVSDSRRTVDLPLDRQLRYSGGVLWDMSESIRAGLAYSFVDSGDASINQTRGPLSGTLSGEYESNYVHVVAVHANFKF